MSVQDTGTDHPWEPQAGTGYDVLLRSVAASIADTDPDAAESLMRAIGPIEDAFAALSRLEADRRGRDEIIVALQHEIRGLRHDLRNRGADRDGWRDIASRRQERAEAAERRVAELTRVIRDHWPTEKAEEIIATALSGGGEPK